jgi:hypothetical protein
MSTKKDFYLAVRAQLETAGVKHVRLYNSQFDEMDNENTFAFPCAFIEFTQLDWLTKSEGYQEADTVVRIHVGFESVKTEELEILDLLETIHSNLQGLHNPEYFTPLDRAFEGQDTNHDNVIVWLLDYDTLLSDNSGNRNLKLVKTTITDLEVNKDNTTDVTKPRLLRI